MGQAALPGGLYISSLPAKAALLGNTVRAHWGIETRLHWVLDVAFREEVAPFQLMTDGGVLSFISTTTVFGTPIDVALSELALESFFPADAATADILRKLSPSVQHDI